MLARVCKERRKKKGKRGKGCRKTAVENILSRRRQNRLRFSLHRAARALLFTVISRRGNVDRRSRKLRVLSRVNFNTKFCPDYINNIRIHGIFSKKKMIKIERGKLKRRRWKGEPCP